MKKIEIFTNYNDFVCKMISVCCKYIFFRKKTRTAFINKDEFDIIISNNHLSYFLSIAPVIEKLSQKYKVALIMERDDVKSARFELSRYFPNCEVVDVNYRLLPYFFCHVHLSSIAGKKQYFARSSQKVFYFHGTANLAGFKKDGMSAYDMILCATQTQLLEVGKLYGGKPARLVGYPKLTPLDLGNTKESPTSNLSVIYCPSYRGILNSRQLPQLFDHESVLKSLLGNKAIQKLIIRPHPQDVKIANENDLVTIFDDIPKIEFDYTENYHAKYMEADVLVTDFSGTAVSFAIIYGKPAICVLKNIGLLEEMQPYATEVCKVSLNLDALKDPDFLKSTSPSLSKNIFELRRLHHNAANEFVLVIQECLSSV